MKNHDTLNRRVIFRLPDGLYEQMVVTVKRGKAKNPSELMRTALQEFLKKDGARQQ